MVKDFINYHIQKKIILIELDKLNDQEQTKPSQPVSKVESINLLPVDNEEYKARRDAALQKPGAVIGQTTLR